MRFKGIFFDLDGTLVDSKLDFDLMRSEMGFPEGVPILEEIEKYRDPVKQAQLNQIVHQHELLGAQESVLIEGVSEVLDYIKSKGLATGVLTRNSRVCTDMMLDKHNLDFDHVITREDCEPKPHPAGLLKLAGLHQLSPEHCLYVGDFVFDIETAHNAGMKSALFSQGENQGAHYHFSHYQSFIPSILNHG